MGFLAFAATLAALPTLAAETPDPTAKVLVLPFAAINPVETQPWLGKSLQQSVVADLTMSAPGRVLSAEASAPDDAAAVDAAKNAEAAYVVRGNFATVGDDLRVTGQVFDANTGKPVTAIKATEPVASVFTLEDELAAQIRRRLTLNPAAARKEVEPAENPVPPMDALHVPQPQQPADPYALAYVAPLSSASPDRQQLDYNYYFAQPADLTYAGAAWGGYGLGWGVGFNYYGFSSFGWGSSCGWRGSSCWGSGSGVNHRDAGQANSVRGLPLGTNAAALHSSGHVSGIRTGGGVAGRR